MSGNKRAMKKATRKGGGRKKAGLAGRAMLYAWPRGSPLDDQEARMVGTLARAWIDGYRAAVRDLKPKRKGGKGHA